MHFFITGATGYLGSVLVEKAIAEGHIVHGLSRTEAGDAKLKALGAVPIRGDLSSFEILELESANADVVFHCAFNHDFGAGFGDAIRADCDAVNAIAKGLKGSGKALIVSSGSGGHVQDPNGGEFDETAAVDDASPFKARKVAEHYALDKTEEGIRVSVIRLAPFVYGRGGSTFLPWLITKAHAAGKSVYIGDGSPCTTTFHVDDAATLYLAAAKHPTGGVFNGTGSTTITAKEVAKAVGKLLDLPVHSISKEEAVKEENLGPILSLVLGTEIRASNKKAREELGWKPTGIDLLTDIIVASYKEFVAKLTQKA